MLVNDACCSNTMTLMTLTWFAYTCKCAIKNRLPMAYPEVNLGTQRAQSASVGKSAGGL